MYYADYKCEWNRAHNKSAWRTVCDKYYEKIKNERRAAAAAEQQYKIWDDVTIGETRQQQCKQKLPLYVIECKKNGERILL